MVGALVDTSIIVDLLRGYPPAHNGFAAQSDLAVSRGVWLEIIEGAPNRIAQRGALKMLRRFDVLELTTTDVVWATDRLIAHNLSHNVDSFDCLIAAVNHRLQLPLYTHNLKHFTPLIGSLAQRPY